MKYTHLLKSTLVFVAVGVGLHTASARAVQGAESTVTIPLDTYLSLIKPKEDVSLTTIESASLSGEFGEKLHLRLTGTSVGRATPQPVLQNTSQFMISKCSGTANVVNRDQMISVLAKDKKFQVDCDLAVKSWGELVFAFSDVLFVASDVKGADSSVDGTRVVLHRKLKELTGTAADVTVTARYQVSVLPESTKFTYFFDIHNPNRAKKPYVLTLVNGESVTQIETAAEYKELDNGKISFNLGAGANHVQITGALGNNKWRSPVAGALQYLMIQNNPMLQLKVETSAKRVSNEDSRMPASFSSSRTYLLDGKSTFSWDAKKLEVLASTGYTIGQAFYNMYVPDEGPGIVEARFSIQNRGTPELALHVPGKPVYLEVDSQPQVLAKDGDGNLLTQIPNGDHQMLVQYKTEKPFTGWISSVNELMVHPATALSNVSVNVGFAKSWSALFGSVLTDTVNRFPLLNVMIALVASLLALGFLKYLPLRKHVKTSFVALIFVLHILMPGLFYAMFLALAVMLLTHHRERVSHAYGSKNRKQKIALVLGACAALLFIYTFGGNPTKKIASLYDDEAYLQLAATDGASLSAAQNPYVQSERKQFAAQKSATKLRDYRGGRADGIAGTAAQSAPPPASEAMMAEDSVAEADLESQPASGIETADEFKGLPAKIRLPAAQHNISFTQGLIDEKAAPGVRLLVINPKVLHVLQWLLIAAFGFLIYRERRSFATYLRLRE